jgi:hypothetical protein
MQIGEVFLGDFYNSANGNVIDKVIETEDFYLPDPWTLQQAVRLFLTYKFVNNTPFVIGVSVTHGSTWHDVTITPTNIGYSFADFRVTGNVIRFRFRSNNATGQFAWRSYMYEYIESGDYIATVQN